MKIKSSVRDTLIREQLWGKQIFLRRVVLYVQVLVNLRVGFRLGLPRPVPGTWRRQPPTERRKRRKSAKMRKLYWSRCTKQSNWSYGFGVHGVSVVLISRRRLLYWPWTLSPLYAMVTALRWLSASTPSSRTFCASSFLPSREIISASEFGAIIGQWSALVFLRSRAHFCK